MYKQRFVAAAMVAFLGLLGVLVGACGNDGNSVSGTRTELPTGSSPTEPPTDRGAAEELVIVSSDQLSFTPSEVTAKASEPVKIVLDNSEAKVLHDFTIDKMHVSDVHMEGGSEDMGHMDDAEADVHVAADPGDKVTLEFTPEEPGEYTFYCSVLGHRQAGMEGTLVVE